MLMGSWLGKYVGEFVVVDVGWLKSLPCLGQSGEKVMDLGVEA